MTGAGNISALGNTWDSVKLALEREKNAVRYLHEWDQYAGLKTRLGAPVDGFALPDHYRSRQRRSMGRVAQLGVYATELALRDAGLFGADIITNGQTGVAYGSATGNSDAVLEFTNLLEHKSINRINTTTYIRMMSHTAAVNIGVYFGTQGRMYTTSSACTASSQAIGFAYEAIRAGQQTVMIAGGAEELCPTQAAQFDVIYAASTRNHKPESSPRPFDTERDGLVLGEGACTLILESLQHAQARGANILGEIVGFATNTDGAHMVRPQRATMQAVMEMALADAGLAGKDIGYVSAHATATEEGDIAESQAMMAVYGPVLVSALKSYTGHTLGACGAFELWATLNMMRDGWFAPTLNLDQLDERCAPLSYIRSGGQALETELVASNNFAFGGINTSLIARAFSAV